LKVQTQDLLRFARGAVESDPSRIDRIIELMDSREFAPDRQNQPKFRKSWPKLAEVRYRKTLHEEDVDRAFGNYAKAAGAGALAGLTLHGRATPRMRAAIGAAAGLGAEGVVREIGHHHRDYYGDRTLVAKRSEKLPAYAGLGIAGVAGAHRLGAWKAGVKANVQGAAAKAKKVAASAAHLDAGPWLAQLGVREEKEQQDLSRQGDGLAA
jgi:hypothetical protein